MAVGSNVKKLRLKRAMTISDLALASSLNPTTITHIENGKVQPKQKTIKMLALALGVEVSEITK